MNSFNIFSALQNYFRSQFSLDLRSVAIFRILLGVVIFADLMLRYQGISEHYSEFGFLPQKLIETINDANKRPYLPTFFLNESIYYQHICFLIGFLLSLLYVFGFYTKIVAPLLWLFFISLLSRNPFIIEGFDVYARTLLLWSCFLPLDERFSIRSLLAATRRSSPQERILTPGVVCIQFQIFIVYFLTALFKMKSAAWHDGSAILNSLSNPMAATCLGLKMLPFQKILSLNTHVILYIELFFPFLLLIPWRTSLLRIVFILTFTLLHLGIFFLMDVGFFSLVSIAGLSILTPTCVWDFLLFRGKDLSLTEKSGQKAAIKLGLIQKILPPLLLGYFIFYNIISFSSPKVWPKNHIRFLNKIVMMFYLNQEWSMYAYLTGKGERTYLLGTEKDTGRIIDVGADREFMQNEPSENFCRHQMHHRTKKYIIRIFKKRELQVRFFQFWCEKYQNLGRPLEKITLLKQKVDSRLNPIFEYPRRVQKCSDLK